MAGVWIPMRTDLFDDPAVIQMAGVLKLDEYGIVGRLHKLWSWANIHLTDGDAAGVSVEWVDRYVSMPGFSAAMRDAGWLEIKAKSVRFPKFEHWNSKCAKRRLSQNRSKKATNRRHESDKPATSDVAKKSPREEKRKEEKKREQKNPTTPPDDEVSTPASTRDNTSAASQHEALFDAIVTVTGSDPKVNASQVGRLTKSFSEAEGPYTAEEVLMMAKQEFQQRELPWVNGRKLTLGEVEKFIGRVRNPSTAQPPTKWPSSVDAEANLMAQYARDAFGGTP